MLIVLQIINKLVAYNHIFIFLTLSKYLYNIIVCKKRKKVRNLPSNGISQIVGLYV